MHDGMCEYSVQLLRMCCLYMEFADAIREGDGGRVLRCWKYMLPNNCLRECNSLKPLSANFLKVS